jgi:hypothetical protein
MGKRHSFRMQQDLNTTRADCETTMVHVGSMRGVQKKSARKRSRLVPMHSTTQGLFV